MLSLSILAFTSAAVIKEEWKGRAIIAGFAFAACAALVSGSGLVVWCVDWYKDRISEARAAIKAFNALFLKVQPHLRTDWGAWTPYASWPMNVTPDYKGGLAKWCENEAPKLGRPDAELLEIARTAYRDENAIKQEWHLDSRLKMREAADTLGQLVQSRVARRVLIKELDRHGILMGAYLEAALAERLAQLNRPPGAISQWAALATHIPRLCEPKPLPPSTLNTLIASIPVGKSVSQLGPAFDFDNSEVKMTDISTHGDRQQIRAKDTKLDVQGWHNHPAES